MNELTDEEANFILDSIDTFLLIEYKTSLEEVLSNMTPDEAFDFICILCNTRNLVRKFLHH